MQVVKHLFSFIRNCWGSVIVALFVASCFPDPLEVKDVPTVEPEIVVATQLIPREQFVVWLTSTFGIQDANNENDPEDRLNQVVVEDAMVTLTGPAGTDTLDYLERGLYGGNQIPFKGGETYKLLVKSRSHGELEATAKVHPRVKFRSVTARLQYNIYDDTLGQVNFTIIDPPEKNWYMLNVQKIGEVEHAGIIREVINPDTFTALLDDEEFGEPRYKGQLDFSLDDLTPGDSVAVSVSNISEEYFRFMEQRLQNRLSFMEFLSEPVNYPTNVEGGKGFFNLHVPDVRIIILEEK